MPPPLAVVVNSATPVEHPPLDDQQFNNLRLLCENSGYSNPEHIIDLTTAWAEVFNQLDISPDSTIVEVGSGTSPKIIFALAANTWFEGNLILVDSDPKLQLVLRKFGSYLPKSFNINAITNNIFDYENVSIDVLVANHFIDDLIAGMYASRENIDYSVIFNKPEEHISFWNRLSSDKEFIYEVINNFSQYLSMLPKDVHLIFSHYSSRFDSSNDIGIKDEVCLLFLAELTASLKERGYSDLNLVVNSNLSWLTLKKTN